MKVNVVDIVYRVVVLNKDIDIETNDVNKVFYDLKSYILKTCNSNSFMFNDKDFEIMYVYSKRRIKIYAP